jgi:hypothetical protein
MDMINRGEALRRNVMAAVLGQKVYISNPESTVVRNNKLLWYLTDSEKAYIKGLWDTVTTKRLDTESEIMSYPLPRVKIAQEMVKEEHGRLFKRSTYDYLTSAQ